MPLSHRSKVFYGDHLYLQVEGKYPFYFGWQGHHEERDELLALVFALHLLAKSIPWVEWSQLRYRALESFLRDQNHLEALPAKSVDTQRIDYFLTLLLEEHFKASLQAFVEQKVLDLSSHFVQQNRQLALFFEELSAYFESPSLFKLYQLCGQEVVFSRGAKVLASYDKILVQELQLAFRKFDLKFVAIEL